MTRSGKVRSTGRLAAWMLAAFLAALAAALPAADVEAGAARRGGAKLVSNWHLGPFFEYRRAEPGDATFWAVRPLFSRLDDPATRTADTDVLWPLVSLRSHADAAWWNALVAFYGDAREDPPAWSFNFVPLVFCGHDRKEAGYWGVFPLYGHHPHFGLMDDWTFALWPVWHTYTVKGVRSHAVLWPFFTWRDDPRAGVGVWPFYGQARQRESDHGYALWPLVTWASYDEDRDTSGAGHSWWFLPFYGEVRRARESQTMVLPPFFSHARTPTATRWRLPWPLVELQESSTRDRISVWPLWEQVRGYAYVDKGKSRPEERTWRVGWQLVENTVLETDRSRETRFNLFPFVTWERRWTKPKEGGAPVPKDAYFRFWPLWSSETVDGRTRCRTLELMPIRHNEGVERNWAPFWSLWEKDERPDGRTRHSLLFNLVHWHVGSGRSEGSPCSGRSPEADD